MATPPLLKQNLNFVVDSVSAQSITFIIKDALGASVDIHVGWAASLACRPAASPNPNFADVELSSVATVTYGADGSLKFSFADNALNVLPCQQSTYILKLTNDSYASICRAASGRITLTD